MTGMAVHNQGQKVKLVQRCDDGPDIPELAPTIFAKDSLLASHLEDINFRPQRPPERGVIVILCSAPQDGKDRKFNRGSADAQLRGEVVPKNASSRNSPCNRDP